MGGRGARVSGEFLGLVDYKGSGTVVKLPRDRVDELIDQGIGQPFAPAAKCSANGLPSRNRTVAVGPNSSSRPLRSSPRRKPLSPCLWSDRRIVLRPVSREAGG